MATVERREQKRDGKTYRSKRWYVRYRDLEGKRKRIAAFADKRTSETLARNIEELMSCRATGTSPPAQLTKALDKLPERILSHLRKAGLLDAAQSAGARPLSEHLKKWSKHLDARGNSSRHIKQRISRASRLLDAIGAAWWSDISGDSVENALIRFRDEEGLSVSTVNAYQSALKQFTRWMYRNRHAPEDPLRHLSRQNPAPHRRCTRRALTEDECLGLLLAASESEENRDGASPQTRALLYRMALETGLRFSELRSLKAHHLNLDGFPPTVSIEAGYSKSKRADTLPLRKGLAEALRAHCSGRDPDDRVFDMWKTAVGARMIKADLESAGIPYHDSQGRVADFHALRHTFITNLARSGVHPKTAQTLARHSTMELTMQVYTLVALDTKEEAVNQLPDFGSNGSMKDAG